MEECLFHNDEKTKQEEETCPLVAIQLCLMNHNGT